MIIFLIAATIMFAIAFMLIIPPLLKKNISVEKSSAENDAIGNETNITIARERLHELKNDLKASRIDQTQFDLARSELEQNLAQALSLSIEKNNTVNNSNNRFLIIALAVILPIIGLGIYLQTGSPIALNPELQKVQQELEKGNLDIETMVAGLAERLKTDPDNGEGWVMLGKSYVAMNRFSEAKEAFSNAHKILGDNVMLLADYADAIGRGNNSDLTGEAKPLIKRAFEIDPHNSKIRWLAGMLAYQEQEFERVPELLQPILAKTEPGSEVHESLKRLVQEAQSQSGQDSVIEETTAPVILKVQVTFDSKFKDQIDPNDVVFIFAKAVQGPPIPLAVARIKASELPTVITLDDGMAMRPDLKISSHQRVNISARISKSGNAIAVSGDLQADTVEVETSRSEIVEIIINQLLP